MRTVFRRSTVGARATCLLLIAEGVAGQPTPRGEARQSAPIANVHYEITADSSALSSRRLHVRTSFDVGGAEAVLLSLPAWTPGAYEISNFARSVSGFAASAHDAPLAWDKLDYDTWRIHPAGAGSVTVSFDYLADTLDNAMSWTRPDFALVNGTNVFLYPEGRPFDFPSTVTVLAAADARIATGLDAGAAPRSYVATSYHELVDRPVFVGRFDLDSATISGRVVRYATYPVGSVRGERRAEAWEQLRRVIPVEVAVFGEAPWSTYTVMQIADSSYRGASGLEHANSHVDVLTPAAIGSPFQPSLYAHEIFHAWNVKRLRPADLVPYRYDAPMPTPWLWVSEGITDYYGDLAMVRGGVIGAPEFYALTAGKIAEIENTVPFSLEDASLNTWIHPRDGTEYSYYPKGSLAGLMLDVLIRDGSNNHRSLDTVMRELYEGTYRQGRGFTHEDFWGAVRRAAGGESFETVERRYVRGREPYPWSTILPRIGLRLVPDSAPRLGISTAPDPTGAMQVLEVAPGSGAARAGMRAGDVLLRVGNIDVTDAQFGEKFRTLYGGRAAGTPVPLTVRRGAQTLDLEGPLTYARGIPRLVEEPSAGARAVRMREGILRGTVDR